MKRPGDQSGTISLQQKRRAFLIALVVGIVLFLVVEKDVAHSDDAHSKGDTPTQGTFTGHEDLASCRGQIPFPRPNIVSCEGYWAPYIGDAGAGGGEPTEAGALPAFRASDFQRPFCGAVEWQRQLDYIEKVASEDQQHDFPPSGLTLSRQRGLSPSRVDGKPLGNKEFRDFFATTNAYAAKRGPQVQNLVKGPNVELYKERMTDLKDDETVCWTGDLVAYYVRSYHAVPSQEFYEYVVSRYALLHSTV